MKRQKKFNKKNKRPRKFMDVEDLKDRISKESPNCGDYLYNYKIDLIKEENSTLQEKELKKLLKLDFGDLPLSSITQKNLYRRNFKTLTEIQRCTIPHALAGRDILAASKTGSGKTLSFLIPVIENLYRMKWTTMDKLGALVIVPTRELAIQVFEVLRSIVDEGHELSYGLVIGGKSYKTEREDINFMNILVCTPGRFLQHLNETEYFDCNNLQMLVLDEADEILSMGFEQTLTSIVDCLPNKRQNMLFSATLNKKIMKLSKLTLKDPEQILLQNREVAKKEGNDNDQSHMYEAPVKLSQFYTIIPHYEKLNLLFSFIKNQQTAKIIVFVSTVKQVRFIFESFKKLRMGLPLYEYHGKQPQPKRTGIFFSFTESKSAVLICTNIAARGLDFPKVDWVFQYDCPENVETYVHRMGRTARFSAAGKNLLVLDPSEVSFIEKVKEKKYTVNKITLNPDKQVAVQKTLTRLLVGNDDIKYLAQRAFISFVKCIHNMADKSVFNVSKIDCKKLALSFGLIQTPVIKIGDKDITEDKVEDTEDTGVVKMNKAQRKLAKLKAKIKKKEKTDLDDTVIQKNLTLKLNQHRQTQKVARTDKIKEKEEDDDDFLIVKRTNDQINIESTSERNQNYKRVKKEKDGEFGLNNNKNIVINKDNKDYINKLKQRIEKNEEESKKIFTNNLKTERSRKRMKKAKNNTEEKYVVELDQD